jgi:CheY-like chemotaxis protein
MPSANAYGSQTPRILIVEDEPLVALDVRNTLAEAGFNIAGAVSTVEQALSFVQAGAVDAAVLDANLNGTSAVPIATALSTLGLPYLVLSGYAIDQQPAELRAAPQVAKPFDPVRLIEVLRGVLGTPT